MIISRQGRKYQDGLYECTGCHRFLSPSEFFKNKNVACALDSRCRDCYRKNHREYDAQNREHRKAQLKKWYQKNREKHLLLQKKYLRELKLKVISAYGGKCECCGETIIEFLAIDHKNGDGKKDRNSGLLGRAMYLHLIKNNFPKDRYRLLCHNCNMAIGFYGKCPHEENR